MRVIVPDDVKITIKQDRVSKQISDQIKNLIAQGNLRPGDKLPSERDLAKSIGTGRLSVREGLRILETMGIVETRYGVDSGTYVSEIGIEKLTGKFSEVLSLSENITLEMLYEARLEIAFVCLKFFIKRGDAEDIRRMEKCLEEQEALLKRRMPTREKNIEFHRLIAEGSKNPVLILVQNSVLEVIMQFLSTFQNPDSYSEKFLEVNKQMLKCLKEKNLSGAIKAMRKYVATARLRVRSQITKTVGKEFIA